MDSRCGRAGGVSSRPGPIATACHGLKADPIYSPPATPHTPHPFPFLPSQHTPMSAPNPEATDASLPVSGKPAQTRIWHR